MAPLRAAQVFSIPLHHRLQDLHPCLDAQAMERFPNTVGCGSFSSAAPTSLYDGGEAGGSWIRQRVVVVRKRRRGPVSDGTCAVSDRWGFSAGTRALRGKFQYASKRRLPVAA